MALTGEARFRILIETAGGSVSPQWAAGFFGISEDAVREQARQGALLAWNTASGDLILPRFQFDGNARLLPGLSKFLAITQSWAPEEQIRFLLVRHEPASSDDTPLTLIQHGEINQVLDLAQVNLQQRP